MLFEFLFLTILASFFAIFKVTFFLHPIFAGVSLATIVGLTIILSILEMILRVPATKLGNGHLGISSINIQLIWIFATFIISCLLAKYMLGEELTPQVYVGFAIMFFGVYVAITGKKQTSK